MNSSSGVTRAILLDSIFSAVEKRLGFAFFVRSWEAAAGRSSAPGQTPEQG